MHEHTHINHEYTDSNQYLHFNTTCKIKHTEERICLAMYIKNSGLFPTAVISRPSHYFQWTTTMPRSSWKGHLPIFTSQHQHYWIIMTKQQHHHTHSIPWILDIFFFYQKRQITTYHTAVCILWQNQWINWQHLSLHRYNKVLLIPENPL